MSYFKSCSRSFRPSSTYKIINFFFDLLSIQVLKIFYDKLKINLKIAVYNPYLINFENYIFIFKKIF